MERSIPSAANHKNHPKGGREARVDLCHKVRERFTRGTEGTDGAKKQLWAEECPQAAMLFLLTIGGDALIFQGDKGSEYTCSHIRNTDTYHILAHTNQSVLALALLKVKRHFTEDKVWLCKWRWTMLVSKSDRLLGMSTIANLNSLSNADSSSIHFIGSGHVWVYETNQSCYFPDHHLTSFPGFTKVSSWLYGVTG